MQIITSLQNPSIRNLIQLQTKSKERKVQGLFPIEGCREINRAIQGGFEINQCFICREILSKEAKELADLENIRQNITEVSQKVYSRISYRENVDGIIVTARIREFSLDSIKLSENPLLLILETVEKPGNLGAILRTADAAALDAVIICDPSTDIYNPNVIRSSLGCLFTNQVIVSDSNRVIRFLKERSIRIIGAALQDSVRYHEEDFTRATSFVMGSEADGLSEVWRKNSDRLVQIPMQGVADSLNVSVAAAVLVFEAARQRLSL